MILDQATKLEAVLAGAVSANQPEYHVNYVAYNAQNEQTVPAPARGALNSASDVTLLAAPVGQVSRLRVEDLSIYNKDTASVTLTLKTDDGTERIRAKATLATGESFHYERGRGYYVLTASGGIKSGAVSVPGTSTDNAVARWDGTTGTAIQNSAFIVDDSGHVTSFGGNITFPATQSASADANTLDDYEEGTWTPSVGGNATYNGRTGTYVKIGRLVYIHMDININVIGTGSASTVSGLPFSTANYAAISAGFFFNLATNVVHLNPVVDSGTATIVFYAAAAAAASNSATSVMGSSTRINAGGGYQV